MTTLHIPNNEQGQVRVFAINRAATDVAGEIEKYGKMTFVSDLIDQELPEAGFELFPMTDLSGVGLSGYLGQGYDVPPEQIAKARAKLDALEGYVLLIFSSAFQGRDVTLTTTADLTLIGTFGEAQPNMQSLPIESGAAQAYSGTPRLTPPVPPRGKAGNAMAIVGLIVITGLALWWALG